MFCSTVGLRGGSGGRVVVSIRIVDVSGSAEPLKSLGRPFGKNAICACEYGCNGIDVGDTSGPGVGDAGRDVPVS